MLHWQEFEKLCVHIISQKHGLVGGQFYARSGIAQDGIDIYAWEKDSEDKRLLAFECKHLDDKGILGDALFSKTVLDETLRRFLDGDLRRFCKQFTIIIPTDLSKPAAKSFQIWHTTFGTKYKIELSIWTRERIWEELSKLPQVASLFIDSRDVDDLCAGYYAHVEKIIRADQKVRTEAERNVRASLLFEAHQRVATQPQINSDGGRFIWTNNILHLDAFLPTDKQPSSGCGITILTLQHESAVITLSHQKILAWLWPGRGASLSCERRKFLSKGNPEGTSYVVNFPGITMFVSPNIARALCDAVDAMITEYLKALLSLERIWEAEHFDFDYDQAGDRKVIIGKVPYETWQTIIHFANQHDCDLGDTAWHMFDRSGALLKPFHKIQTHRYDCGYHAILSVSQPHLDVLGTVAARSDVHILWAPPSANVQINDHGYWGCQTTLEWIQNELIPQVLQASQRNSRRAFFSQKAVEEKPTLSFLDYRDFDAIVLKSPFTEESLLECSDRLQAEFANIAGMDPIVATRPEYIDLLDAIETMVRVLGVSDWSYIAGNLQLNRLSKGSQSSFSAAIKVHATTITSDSVSCRHVELALRSLSWLIGGSKKSLSVSMKRNIAHALSPLMNLIAEVQLVRRHMSTD